MSPARAAAVVLAAVLAGGACRREVTIEEEPATLLCRHGADCDAKWRRAHDWVVAHSRWPIREESDAAIATAAPPESDTLSPAFLVRRVPRTTEPDVDAIVFFGGCGPRVRAFVDHLPARGERWRNVSGPDAKLTECVPPVGELERDFARFVSRVRD